MKHYQHILVLVNDEKDGVVLMRQAQNMASPDSRLTLAHILMDYRALNYISDSVMNDVESEQVIHSKEMLSKVVVNAGCPASTRVIVSLDRFRALAKFILNEHVDLVIVGHHNRLFGVLTSRSMAFINNLDVDCFISHIA